MKNTFNALKRFFRLHAVKIIMLGLTIGFFTYDMSQGATSSCTYFIALLILFQVRGIMWEDSYYRQAIRLQTQIEELEK